MVLSGDGVSDAVLALVSPMPSEATPMRDSALSALLVEWTQQAKVRTPQAAALPVTNLRGARWGFSFGKAATSGKTVAPMSMKRTALAPGAPLARKTPLVRKTPPHGGERTSFGRGKPFGGGTSEQ